jgi:hypothetical protein
LDIPSEKKQKKKGENKKGKPLKIYGLETGMPMNWGLFRGGVPDSTLFVDKLEKIVSKTPQ